MIFRHQVPPFAKGGQGGFGLVKQYDHRLKGPSRKLRQQMTDAERLLWSRLRAKQIWGIQFNRQKPVGPYVVDFYAAAAQLVIEVDGSQHLEGEDAKRDAIRDIFLQEQGVMVLRFDNRQVLTETAAVLEEIFRVCQQRANPPCPPFAKGGT
jgi:very-short-patch-repair endonuclease